VTPDGQIDLAPAKIRFLMAPGYGRLEPLKRPTVRRVLSVKRLANGAGMHES